MTPATICVRLKSGAPRTFHASECEIRGDLVMATGRWANAPRSTGAYVWPSRRIISLRWEAVSYV